jgi:choline dehydrogenase
MRTVHSNPSALLRYTASGSEEFNDMQLWLQTVVDWTMLSGLPVEPSTPPKLIAFPALQRPRSRGRLTLRSASPDDQPIIELNYLADPEDMRRMIDGMRLAWRIVHQPAVAEGWQGPIVGETGQVLDQATVTSDSLLIDFMRNNCTTLFHPVGTARMGPANDSMAVVDQYCRVRGVEGLRVVDASVMPNIVRANTNLTCIMIGERVADWMRAEA